MRLLIVTQYFHPENFRVNDLAFWFARRGHQVTVITGIPNYPGGRFHDGYGLFRRNREQREGVTIVRMPLIPRGSGSGLRLALNYASFAFCASLFSLWRVRGKFDAIFVHQPSPVTVGIPAMVMRRRTGARIYFWVLDLWPESVAAAGGVRSRRVLGVLARLTRRIYSSCEKVLVQSRAFFDPVRAMGVPGERIAYFPNWAEDVFRPVRPDRPLAGLPPGFRIIYAGNIGNAQDFPTVIAAAEKLKDIRDLHWILIGDGRESAWVRRQVEERGLGNTVHLLGGFPIEQMPSFFAHANTMLVSLSANPVFALTVPAKVQAYMACGRPILAMLEGEGARVVNESGAGFTCAAGDAAGLADAALRMYRMGGAELERMGARGREYYLAHFDREQLFRQLEDWMGEAAPGPASDGAGGR